MPFPERNRVGHYSACSGLPYVSQFSNDRKWYAFENSEGIVHFVLTRLKQKKHFILFCQSFAYLKVEKVRRRFRNCDDTTKIKILLSNDAVVPITGTYTQELS